MQKWYIGKHCKTSDLVNVTIDQSHGKGVQDKRAISHGIRPRLGALEQARSKVERPEMEGWKCANVSERELRKLNLVPT